MSNLPEPFKTYETLSKAYVELWYSWWASFWSIGPGLLNIYSGPVSVPIPKVKVGQAWYDPTSGVLKKWNGYRWVAKLRIVR